MVQGGVDGGQVLADLFRQFGEFGMRQPGCPGQPAGQGVLAFSSFELERGPQPFFEQVSAPEVRMGLPGQPRRLRTQHPACLLPGRAARKKALDCACGLYLADPTAWLSQPPPDELTGATTSPRRGAPEPRLTVRTGSTRGSRRGTCGMSLATRGPQLASVSTQRRKLNAIWQEGGRSVLYRCLWVQVSSAL